MTSRIGGPGCAALRRGAVAGLFFAFALTAGAASGGDNAAFVSYSDVPSTMMPGGTATVTVTMRNTGTTTWKATVETEADDFEQTRTRTTFLLDAVGDGWGVNGVAVTGSVAPNATRSFEFTITAPETERSYTFQWQMSRDTVVTSRPIHARSPTSFGARTPSRTIVVERDTAPSFGNATIPDQDWVKDSRITPVTLPGATGGNGTLSYALTCSLPRGVSFASATKRISGTPRTVLSETECTWKVTDADDNTAASDADTLTFTIEVVPPDTAPSFGSQTIQNRVWEERVTITSLTLPAATGGNGALTYSLSPEEPDGVRFVPSARTLSGRPTAPQSVTTYTYTVTDSDSNTSASDADTLTFTIEVEEEDVPPSFGGATIPDQTWVKDSRITPVTLPEATGGNGALSYTLSCSLPRGVARNSFRISGTPRTVLSETDCIWKVTDADDNTSASDTDTLTFTIEVVLPDTPPAFRPGARIHDIILTQDLTFRAFALPAASGGNGALIYTLSPEEPDGVTLDPSTRMLSGTPAATQSARTYTYTVTDSDSNTSASDSDTLTFRITIVEPDTEPSFPPGVTILDQWWVRGRAIAGGTLPAASGGNAPLSYTLSPLLPTGVTFYPSSRQVWGTPTATQGVTTYTYTVTDADGDTATLNFIIEVAEPDTAPSFGNQTIPDQDWVKDNRIAPVSLPEATGGNGALSYALSCSLPQGVARNSLRISGTPRTVLSETECIWKVTDADDNTSASDSDTLEFTIEVEPPDTAPSFGNQTIPDQDWVKDNRIAPVSLPEATGGNGALSYALSCSLPQGVARNSLRISGTPRTVLSETECIWKVTDADDNTSASDSDTLMFTIEVEPPDTAPSFGNQTTPDQDWVKDNRIAPVSLPEATGGNGTLTYALSPSPPAGVTFNATARTLSGTPTATQGATPYTYTVTDSDGNTTPSDAHTLTFTIEVVEPDTAPSFGTETADDLILTRNQAMAAATLPAATGGNGDLIYALAGDLPAGVTFNASTQTLSGTPTQGATPYTYTVTDSDGNTAASDTHTLTFTIEVEEADTAPSFGTETADDLILTRNQAMAAATLPAATGGNGDLIYALAGDLPAGVTFNASTQTLSGTPTATQGATPYTYTVTDSDGNTAASDADTLTFTIAVEEADTAPSFGTEMADDLILTRNQAMAAATLPAATGGNGDLTYSLTGDLPAGVTFDATTRTLSGTPTERQAALEYTYTATDADGNTAPSDAVSLSFTIEVAGMGSDDASFVSYSNVPSTMTAGSSATVTVRMRNTGTTTWTSAEGYALGSRRPLDNVTWGLNRVPLPADVAPNATVDFTFAITAPATVQGHKFSWRMVRGASGWFGDKTELREITVEAAGSPSFGESPILGQTWVKDVAIDALTLPAATGGAGELAYTLAGTLPGGVTFDALTRTLSGTPAKKQEATEYTYTATDADGDAASLSFTIEVERRSSDEASFVSYTGVPSTMAAGSSATVTVWMQNTGTTTWTSAGGYELGSQRPQDNVTWGLSRVALPSEVAPNATVDFTFTITAPATVKGHNFRWRMIRGTDGWFGDKTELRAITVEADESPSFGASTIPAQTWVKNTAVASSTLPAATGGNGELAYALAGDLPSGVTFDVSTRMLSGTPAKKQEATEYTYTATDLDGDAASLAFTIEVAGRARDDASFGSYVDVPSTMAAGSSATVTVRMRNTGTTTWTSAGGYELGSQRPQDNVTWGLSRVSLASDVAPNATVDFTFAITAPATVKGHKFRWRMLRGAAGWFGDKTELHEIAVEDPSFGDATIPDQTWARAVPIDALTLPEASGSGGVLTYTLTPSLPDGLAFTASTRTVSGTPTTVQAATEYTYTATDIDGDAATLLFTIAIEAAETDDASFVSVSGVPSKMAVGGTATVAVTMTNTGTTTWTSSAGYGLGSQSPQDNETWGLSRVSVPSDVAPNESVAFTFTITAPESPNTYTFAWRMVRDPGAWFGSGTGDVAITVEDPSFGDATVADQTWAQDMVVDALTLPAASGSGGALTYALTPSPPAGVTFTASTRTLSGTPTAAQGPTEYTYTATDAGGRAATLTFEIAIEAVEMDDAAFVSSSGVPSKMAAGDTATVTVTMTNTGTTTWTSSAGYNLGSESPQNNDTWGLRRASVSGSAAPNETVSFTFTITAPAASGSYTFAWRMVRDPGAWFGSGTGDVTITVEDPSFGDATISDQTWVQNTAIEALTLPEASGSGGVLTYALTPSLPDGLSFSATTRVLSGTPTAVQAATVYAYTATDAAGDAATLSFSVAVTPSSSSTSQSATALPPPEPAGVFDMFEYWLLPRGSALTVQARLRDGRIAPVEGSSYLRSFWRGELWGRKVALLGDPSGERYDIFEEVEDGPRLLGHLRRRRDRRRSRSELVAGPPFSLDEPLHGRG